jgi:hypothetical protein
MSVFPGATPPAGSASSSATLAAAGHTSLHNTDRDEIRALATKVGTGSSTATSGTVLRGTGAGTSSWSQVNVGSDVTGVLPVANGGTGATNEADARENLELNTALEILAMVYPVGSIYVNATSSTNPATLLGFGTWSAFAAGRVMVGNGTSDQLFSAGATGGASTHTLTSAEMPSHTHTGTVGTGAFGDFTRTAATIAPEGNASVGSTGGGGSHNNLQPYIVVYAWRRTA